MNREIYTIGYGNRELDDFLVLLASYQVQVICDVRSTPYSKRYPDYGRERLRSALKSAGITYMFFGDTLGARPNDPSLYRNGRASYEAMAQGTEFKASINRLATGAETHVISLLCAEKDPLDCHRAILIARYLVESGTTMKHIDAGGRIQTQKALESRLIKQYGLDQVALFGASEDEEALREAYRRRGEDLAYDVDAAYRARPSA